MLAWTRVIVVELERVDELGLYFGGVDRTC